MTVSPRIKICGITRPQDCLAAVSLGAWAVGFIFWPQSPRFIEPERAAQLVKRLQATGGQVKTVGVFVNATPTEIQSIRKTVGFELAQLHGNERPGDFAQLGFPLIRALRPKSEGDLDRADLPAWVGLPCFHSFLIDAAVEGRYGGTGQLSDWRLFARVRSTYPRTLLSGGLRPETVARAIEELEPWGIDVSSGIEELPGIKDAELLASFFEATIRRTA